MNKKITVLFSASLLTLSLSAPAWADIYPGYLGIDSGNIQEIEHPGNSRDGLLNTMLSQLLTGPVGEEYEIRISRGPHADPNIGSDPFVVGFERVFKVQLKHQVKKEGAHLVVVIPGFGASNKEAAAPFLSELLNRSGMVTLSSHSPANPEFIQHSSSIAIPGNQKWDAQDIYDMIREAKVRLEKDFGYKFSKISVIGASLGSMNAFHIGGIDRSHRNPIGFHKVISMNPPISNVWGSTTIDTFVAYSMGLNDKFDMRAKLGAFASALKGLALPALTKDDYEKISESSLKTQTKLREGSFTQKELKFLVGFGFAPTVDKVIAAGMLRYDEEMAATQYSTSRMRPVKFFTGFLEKYSFSNLISYKLRGNIRNYVERLPDNFSFDEKKFPHFNATEKESISYLVPQWQGRNIDLSNFHLITWHDDFLLRPTDPKWIEDTLTGGKKGTGKVFYNGGGHLGGYWQNEFQSYLINILK